MKRSTAIARMLATSLLSLLMCVSMLVGTTYAWFTDTATATVSPVQTGTLGITLEKSTDGGVVWQTAENSQLDFVAPEGGAVVWEPGASYSLPLLRVRNSGDLAAKFVLEVNIPEGQPLAQVIEWSMTCSEEQTLLPGDVSPQFQITATMRQGVGMEYQGLQLDGITISVYAAQLSHEQDSNGSDYDAGATYDKDFTPAAPPAAAMPGMAEYMAQKAAAGTRFNDVKPSYAPFAYTNLKQFENTRVEYINVMMNSYTPGEELPYITVYVANNVTAAINREYKFYAREEDLNARAATPGIISLYPSQTVTVGEGETLLFCKQGDTLTWGYIPSDGGAPAELKRFYNSIKNGFSNIDSNGILCLDVYTTPYVDPNAPKPLQPDVSGYAILSGLADYIDSKTNFSDVNFNYSGFTYLDLDMFCNTQVDHINVMANKVTAMDSEQYMTVFVVDSATAQVKRTHKFYAKQEALLSLTPGRVVSLYPRETVTVDEGETLMFSQKGDPLTWGYISGGGGAASHFKGFFTKSTVSSTDTSSALCIDVYTTAAPELPPLPADDQALKDILQGKKLSILGDSISTYTGWSNSTAVNDTLGNNEVWYNSASRLSSVDQTWWKQTADKYGMEMLVNNSWSGSSVTNVRESRGEASFGWNIRPGNLHDNTLANNPGGQPIEPDIIAVYMGTNDLMDGVGCDPDAVNAAGFWEKIEAEDFVPSAKTNFEEACAVMLYKVKKNYPNATVFCFNNPTMRTGNAADRNAYNAAMAAIAQHYGIHVVDLYGSSISTYGSYTHDGIHPTAAGMELMAQAFAQSLKAVFTPES